MVKIMNSGRGNKILHRGWVSASCTDIPVRAEIIIFIRVSVMPRDIKPESEAITAYVTGSLQM
jgi:hypothetical protein